MDVLSNKWECPVCGQDNSEKPFCPGCGYKRKVFRDHYDAFISYRRNLGSEPASLIQILLEKYEKYAFLDVTELQVGRFDEKLLEQIEKSDAFILLLSQGALDRCTNKTDWLKREIVHALQHDKTIIPVIMPGFKFPDEAALALLPEEMRNLPNFQAIEYSHVNREIMGRKIAEYISIGKQKSKSKTNIDVIKEVSVIKNNINELVENNQKKTLSKSKEKFKIIDFPEGNYEEWLKYQKYGLRNKFNTIIIDESFVNIHPTDNKNILSDFANADEIIINYVHLLSDDNFCEKLFYFKQKLITIVDLNQITHYNVKVSNDKSWEQTALDIVYGLYQEKTLKNLFKCREVIVTIGTAGAICIKTSENLADNEYNLIFDPEHMENEWEEKYSDHIQNKTGLDKIFISAFISPFCRYENINSRIKIGLNAMNASMLKGAYHFNDRYLLESKDLYDAIYNRFFERYYSTAYVPSPAWEPSYRYLHNKEWSILENNYDNFKPGYKQKHNLFSLAYSLAKDGINSLHYAPRLTLNDVTVFERSEIENINNIKKQIEIYDKYGDGKKPLNIAVFGPPATDKKFIIKAVVNNIFEEKNTKYSFITCNLSQFRDESQLTEAYHIIRDEVIQGKLPIVFCEEFDSNDYHWLKNLIAPMQEGKFQDRKEVHIGKSIFIFTGEMTYTMSHFIQKMENETYLIKKGSDFQSLINCFYNASGPNRKPYYDTQTGRWLTEGDQSDIGFSIRRALIIRSILNSNNKPLHIDNQLLRVLIEVSSYKNGPRGLERLIKNLAIDIDKMIERSDIPSKEIIDMNVDYSDFMDKLSYTKINEIIAFENISVNIHKSWLEEGDNYPIYSKKYKDLNYEERLDNIKAAFRMKDVISITNEFMLISETDLKLKRLPDAKNEFIEHVKDTNTLDMLAEEEHVGWIKARTDSNWKLGKRSDYHKMHHCLVPFNELDKGIEDRQKQKEKNKDRVTISYYVSMLEGSGFTITLK